MNSLIGIFQRFLVKLKAILFMLWKFKNIYLQVHLSVAIFHIFFSVFCLVKLHHSNERFDILFKQE